MNPRFTFTAAIIVTGLSLAALPVSAQSRGAEGRARSGERTVQQGASASRQATGRQATPRTSGVRQPAAPQATSQASGSRQSPVPQTVVRGNGNQPSSAPQTMTRGNENRQNSAPQTMSRGNENRQSAPPQIAPRTSGTRQSQPQPGVSQGAGNRQPQSPQNMSRGGVNQPYSAPQTMTRGSENRQSAPPQMAPRAADNQRYTGHQAVPRGSVMGPGAPRPQPPMNNRYEWSGGYGPYYSGPYVRPYDFRPYRPYYFSRPYYSFRARLNLGFGLWIGFNVPYPWSYFGDYRPRVYGYYDNRYYGVAPGVQYYGGLSFDMQPSDADLWVDGEYVGMVGTFTPYGEPLTLLPGVHRIAIVRDGFRTMEWDVTVEPGLVIPYRGVMEPW